MVTTGGAAVARIDRESIEATYAIIKPYIRTTPVVEVYGVEFGLARFPLVLKLEQLQHSGSFKARGAFAHLLLRDIPALGVAAASGGNHGAAVAYAAMRLGVPARIFVPTVCSAAKIQRIRDYGAELVIVGDRYADALAASEAWIAESGAMSIHAYDQVETLLGQGTLGEELMFQAPPLTHPDAGDQSGKAGRCSGGKRRTRFARASARRRFDVPHRSGACRSRRVGQRCFHPASAGGALVGDEDRGRTRCRGGDGASS